MDFPLDVRHIKTKIGKLQYDSLAGISLHYHTLHTTSPIYLLLKSKCHHAHELHQLQGRSIAGSPAPVLRWMPVRTVLFQGLSEGRLAEASQANMQASQRGAWRHASED
jgi:hypothetical protein